jgi:hypothetical protein
MGHRLEAKQHLVGEPMLWKPHDSKAAQIGLASARTKESYGLSRSARWAEAHAGATSAPF